MSEKKLTREADTSTLYEFKGSVPKPSLLVPLSLQHVLAAVVGVITPSIIIAGVCGLTESEKTMMIQAALLLTAIATLLQLFPIFNRLGAGLPVIMGTSFAYVPTLQAIGGEFDMGTILGAEIIGGIVAIIFGIFVKEKTISGCCYWNCNFYNWSFSLSNCDKIHGWGSRIKRIWKYEELGCCSLYVWNCSYFK